MFPLFITVIINARGCKNTTIRLLHTYFGVHLGINAHCTYLNAYLSYYLFYSLDQT